MQSVASCSRAPVPCAASAASAPNAARAAAPHALTSASSASLSSTRSPCCWRRRRHGSTLLLLPLSSPPLPAPRSASVFARASSTAEKEPQRNKTVADIMTKGVFTVTADATVDEALDILVSKRITGLPVVDSEGLVIGVVSDFDLLSLDIPDVAPNGIFPAPGNDWASFFSAQVAASKGAARLVRDVMTPDPLVVRGGDAADAAARTLLARKVRRLPVVDGSGKLIGLFSRSDVLKAAWEARKEGKEGKARSAAV